MSFFDASLKIGQIGEALYYSANAGRLERLDGLKADFKCMSTGDLYEVKMDSYSMQETPNVFIEVLSDTARGKLGGPYQAQQNNCRYYVYMFVRDLTTLTFDTNALINRIADLAPSLKPLKIQNATWTTEGYLVPRELLKDIYVMEEMKMVKK